MSDRGDALTLRDVHLARGGTPVLAGMSLRLGPGEFVALVGPSGCGKSSLLDLAAGLLPPDAGQVALPGAGADRLGHLALMPQGDSLLPWRTVRENVEVGARLAGGDRRAVAREALAQLHRVGLAAYADHYPHVLSGGMRQRVALARTVLSGRRVWLLDEPFAALDALTRADLHGDLERLWLRDRPAVLMVTHDTEEAVRLADRVVVAGPRPM
ncbi:MAG TPA: ATP-binding cassette domain-containing protein, partial [Miltoncostaeaceae bacterium]|nr:ATP-binding cassette domain-containing protein [Miltoncostaeaceae bacterium]